MASTQCKLPVYPPVKLIWVGSPTFRISGIHFDFLHEKIQKFFSKFSEVLKIVEWNPEICVWNIEYGTRPMYFRDGVDRKQAALIKKSAWEAASKAAKPRMANDGHLDFERKSWHNSELQIYRDPENDDIILEFLLTEYEYHHISFRYIFNEFDRYFSKDNIRFWMREQFLGLINDTEFVYEHRYILNELIDYDICTYLDTTVKRIRPAFPF